MTVTIQAPLLRKDVSGAEYTGGKGQFPVPGVIRMLSKATWC